MIPYYKHAVDIEVWLSVYTNFQMGKYLSSRGLMDIKTMQDAHIRNALVELKKKRDIRAALVATLESDETDNNMIDLIKLTYHDNEDLLSLKIQELEAELKTRPQK